MTSACSYLGNEKFIVIKSENVTILAFYLLAFSKHYL